MLLAVLAGQRAGGDLERLLAERQSRIPLGFMGDGRDTAHAAIFLASEEARFVTGTEASKPNPEPETHPRRMSAWA